ncbi:isopenicillin N synthase family dioxygenase [Actinokineospora globicatena]|uniref:2OG-Fe(II) oxygenase n=1 Tax=Actinokineospora globicatena TaxID=103729 RepID=A0A9W6QJH9_9PSEU|nr:2OG-Fe(II) oxygenase family protein [Actinokineospora globicatena]MCP2303820.1 Isopenicillin N synthase [Actinokineospora globicatena]GLW79027.1 2OG-Fe(II) oxygenase [Actinokineospora globicatena]GLW86562.1 2OG-Fe(II) oxygenase [Actinokineospora globicatena]GLW89649.1 2OG-Fe(II) oxygenase [Actinokineospora globicatena]
MTISEAGTRKAPVTLIDGYVPVIDLSSAREGDERARALVAKTLGRVCETSGFLAIVGHGVPQERIDEMYRATREFFALADERKLALVSTPDDPLMRGFGRQGSLAASNSDASVEQERDLPDLSQTYTYNRLGEPNGPTLPEGSNPLLTTPNLWPELPGFAEAYRAYYASMEDLATELMRLFALALDLPENWFDDKVDDHMTNLTANYYPAQLVPPKPGQLRKGQHSDWGSLTILYQDDAPGGLQVLDKVGEWVDVPAIEGSFVVNIGDLMAIWTNDRWVSTVHRVVNPAPELAAKERFSVPFFHQPNYGALIECIPTCTAPGNPPRYAPVYSGEYIMEKFRRAYGE